MTRTRNGLLALLFLAGCSNAADQNADQNADPAATASGAMPAATPAAAQLDPTEAQEGWRLLFDGVSLDGWVPRADASWQVVDGTITPASPGPGFLTTAESFGDFQLRLEFWEDEVANGGVFLRLPAEGEITQFNAIEVNISDSAPEWPTGSVNQIQRHDPEPTIGKWNTYDVTAVGDRVTVVLNGVTTVDAQVPDRLASGPIAVQILADGEVRYRNIRIREL